jgi:hypothetical protein
LEKPYNKKEKTGRPESKRDKLAPRKEITPIYRKQTDYI